MRPKEEILQNFVVLFVVVLATVIVFLLVYLGTKTLDRFCEIFKAYRRRNKLYRCNHQDCKRLYRRYQIELTQAIKENDNCPHCGRKKISPRNVWESEVSHTEIKVSDEWMDHNSDCMKITKREYFKIRQAIKTAKKLREDEEAIKRFEEYNKFSKDSHWIKNLYKNKE